MKKISIIVPVYNVEKYVEKCIQSLINQSYKNIEIILVDDGSNDSSPATINHSDSSDLMVSHQHVVEFHRLRLHSISMQMVS